MQKLFTFPLPKKGISPKPRCYLLACTFSKIISVQLHFILWVLVHVGSNAAQSHADDRHASFSPMIETQPVLVTSTTLSIRLLVPLAKLSHSNTPTGPFHTICLALWTASALALALSGPQSKPCGDGLHPWGEAPSGSTLGGQNLALPSSRQGFPLRRLQCQWWPSRQTCLRWQSQRAEWSWPCSSQPWPSAPWRCQHPPRHTEMYQSGGKNVKRNDLN